MALHYRGTYSFGPGGNLDSEDTAGDYTSDPTSLAFIDDVTYNPDTQTVMIEDEVDGHKNVLTLEQGADNSDLLRVYNEKAPESGFTDEFWLRSEGEGFNYYYLDFKYREGDDLRTVLKFYTHDLLFNNGTEWISVVEDYFYPGGWYHIKVEYKDTNKAEITVDGVNYGEFDTQEDITGDGYDRLQVQMRDKTSFSYQLDGWGRSGDSDYEVGDNLLWAYSARLYSTGVLKIVELNEVDYVDRIQLTKEGVLIAKEFIEDDTIGQTMKFMDDDTVKVSNYFEEVSP